MAFSKHLEEIIEAALADGVITDKERAVLHKKAQMEGVDPDEVDVVIDGRLQQKYNEVEAAKQKIRKCPSCGEMIPAMTAICPNCGQVVDTSNPDNKALAKYMDKLENSLVELKKDGVKKFSPKVRAELESQIRQGRSLYGDNKKINYLISEVEASIENFEKKRRNLFIAVIVAVIALILFCFGMCSHSQHVAELKEQARVERVDSLKKIIDSQFSKIESEIKSLPKPTKANYDECVMKFKNISWERIDCDSESDDNDEHREASTYQRIKEEQAEKLIIGYIKLLHEIELPYINPETGKQTTEETRYYKDSEGSGNKQNEENPKYYETGDWDIDSKARL